VRPMDTGRVDVRDSTIVGGLERRAGVGYTRSALSQLLYARSEMSKAFIASVLQESAELTGVAANQAATDLISAIVKEMKKAGKFTLPGFGTFTVRKTKARQALNPRTGEKVKVKAGKTVRFKASPTLKTAV
jgi:DNA-binding protein HU-beta